MAFNNPAWIDPIEATFDEGKPIRSEQGLMLAGNPIAIAQGAAGSPKIADKTVLIDSLTTTINNIGDFNGFWIEIGGDTSTFEDSDITVEFSDDGSTFYGQTTLFSVPVNSSMIGRSFFDFISGTYKSLVGIGGYNALSGSVSGLTTSVVSVKITNSGASMVSMDGIMRFQGGESAA